MAGIEHLRNKIEKLSKNTRKTEKIESIVYMDEHGELLWEENVKYNSTGVLAVPCLVGMDEWEK